MRDSVKEVASAHHAPFFRPAWRMIARSDHARAYRNDPIPHFLLCHEVGIETGRPRLAHCPASPVEPKPFQARAGRAGRGLGKRHGDGTCPRSRGSPTLAGAYNSRLLDLSPQADLTALRAHLPTYRHQVAWPE
ncbi:hypothetical protein O4J55_07530 [Paracoccus sp. PXZ]